MWFLFEISYNDIYVIRNLETCVSEEECQSNKDSYQSSVDIWKDI
jgi:hypothetical protein